MQSHKWKLLLLAIVQPHEKSKLWLCCYADSALSWLVSAAIRFRAKAESEAHLNWNLSQYNTLNAGLNANLNLSSNLTQLLNQKLNFYLHLSKLAFQFQSLVHFCACACDGSMWITRWLLVWKHHSLSVKNNQQENLALCKSIWRRISGGPECNSLSAFSSRMWKAWTFFGDPLHQELLVRTTAFKRQQVRVSQQIYMGSSLILLVSMRVEDL